MIRLHNALKARKLGARLVLQVHDELLLDVPRQEEAEVKELVKDSMIHALNLGIPLGVELGSGINWLEAH